MKYIVLSVPMGPNLSREMPIIFPDALVHIDVAEVLTRLPELRHAKPVSAGFVNSMELSPACHGESTTLKLKSRGEDDDWLMRTFDYTHGIVG